MIFRFILLCLKFMMSMPDADVDPMMKRSKENGLCCGAGGSQIFKESEEGKAEINIERINDVQAVEPKTVALACPFCMTMISDGIKEKNLDLKIKVKDITEIIADNLKD